MNTTDNILKLNAKLDEAEAVIIGAGAGLSTSAGFEYAGERFKEYFSDFEERFGFHDMYAGGFYPFPDIETFWAYWSRAIWVNRYMPIPNSTYSDLLNLIKNKDYFVITTNVDHCFQRSNFEKSRLYYMQGDYGLFQCSAACHNKTYDNNEVVVNMLTSQGFCINSDMNLVPRETNIKAKIATNLIPKCPVCGRPMTTNLRIDDKFVEDEGWHKANARYNSFVEQNKGNSVLLLELGVGFNTPGIIKYPFWKFAKTNKNWAYACINASQAYVPDTIKENSICIDADISKVVKSMLQK